MTDEPVRVGCTIMVVRDGKVLLGERGDACETIPGVWAFPGGRMDYGETPEASIVRELKEETGLVIDEADLIFLRYGNEFFPEAGKHYVSLVFMVKCPEGKLERKEKEKCKAWDWFDPENLPKNTFRAAKITILTNRWKIATA